MQPKMRHHEDAPTATYSHAARQQRWKAQRRSVHFPAANDALEASPRPPLEPTYRVADKFQLKPGQRAELARLVRAPADALSSASGGGRRPPLRVFRCETNVFFVSYALTNFV